MWAFPILAVFAGAAITLQAGMNARLGVLFKNPLLATAIAFLMACVFTLIFMMATHRQLPVASDFKSIPTYLWFGGILSAFGVGSYYYLIPKMGVMQARKVNALLVTANNESKQAIGALKMHDLLKAGVV